MSKIGDNDDDSDYWKGSGKTPEAMKDPRIANLQKKLDYCKKKEARDLAVFLTQEEHLRIAENDIKFMKGVIERLEEEAKQTEDTFINIIRGMGIDAG